MGASKQHGGGRRTRWAAALALAWAVAPVLAADGPQPLPPRKPVDLDQGKTLYAVGYAHLDTQWRWSYPQVIRDFLKATLNDNPPLLDKYPNYVFNFTGSKRYQLMKEYYPAEYERMKGYIKAGRWFPGGSNVDETDQNVPSAESVVRQVLYANHFFRSEFGVCGTDFMVPDCFGFPASLPTVLAHCSIKGFNTQKVRWGWQKEGIPPFKVGLWEGVDGSTVVAALDPGSYNSSVDGDLSHDATWIGRADDAAKQANGLAVDYRYYGVGDRGGSPQEKSVANMEKSIAGGGPLKIIPATSDQLFRELTPEQRAKLPKYKGDFLLTWHSSGSITSQGYMKRWNRKNELLADAAERASVAAAWLGGTPYPTRKLYDSWQLLLEGQMHDILPGDCLPKCYEYSWNDEILAANGFAAAETSGVSAVAAAMDTAGAGVPLVVYNPLGVDRTDVVEATVALPGPLPASVTVTGPDGKDCVAGVVGTDGGKLKVQFLAAVPGTGFATFIVKGADATNARPAVSASGRTVENDRYRVTVNEAGDVAEVFDKRHNRNLLSGPIRLGFLHQNPEKYPAWNMDWADRQQACQSYVDGPATIKVVESGPVRAAIEITRAARGSKFTQRVQLTAGGDTVEFPTHVDWQTTECSLEAVMPLGVAAPTATYDTQVGATVRGNNDEKKYEVPQQQWLDVTAPDHGYGVSVLNDCKYGSDKPDDGTVRLTLLYTPAVRNRYQDEASQDFGRHDMTYALSGHSGDWKSGKTPNLAARLNQPLVAFQTTAHPGMLGRQFSLLTVSDPAVVVQAIKKAEDSDDVIVRLKETEDKPADHVRLTFAGQVVSAREVDGQEAEIGQATVTDGKLVTDLKPWHLRAFAVKLAPPAAPLVAAKVTPVALPFNEDVVTTQKKLDDGQFDKPGRSYPAEVFPAELMTDGIPFTLGPTADGQKNALSCQGQTIAIPAGTQRLYLLAASTGDAAVAFRFGDKAAGLTVQDWRAPIGRWDNRLWKGKVSELTYNWSNRLAGLAPGWTKRDEVAWYADHRHDPKAGNEIWEYCYLFKYGLDVPAGATSVTLPTDERVRLFAMSAAAGAHDDAVPAQPLYDTLADHVRDGAPRITVDGTQVRIDPPLYWQAGRLHYTQDGSDPTPTSPVYEAPFTVAAPATVKACEFDPNNRPGAIATLKVGG